MWPPLPQHCLFPAHWGPMRQQHLKMPPLAPTADPPTPALLALKAGVTLACTIDLVTHSSPGLQARSTWHPETTYSLNSTIRALESGVSVGSHSHLQCKAPASGQHTYTHKLAQRTCHTASAPYPTTDSHSPSGPFPFTFFRTTKSFSELVLLLISSSYLAKGQETQTGWRDAWGRGLPEVTS